MHDGGITYRKDHVQRKTVQGGARCRKLAWCMILVCTFVWFLPRREAPRHEPRAPGVNKAVREHPDCVGNGCTQRCHEAKEKHFYETHFSFHCIFLCCVGLISCLFSLSFYFAWVEGGLVIMSVVYLLHCLVFKLYSVHL